MIQWKDSSKGQSAAYEAHIAIDILKNVVQVRSECTKTHTASLYINTPFSLARIPCWKETLLIPSSSIPNYFVRVVAFLVQNELMSRSSDRHSSQS